MPVELDAHHRRHAVMELAIHDLKQGAGLRHRPSGRFLANAAWLIALPGRLTARPDVDSSTWVVQPVDIAALLPVPSRWQRHDHEDFTCWQFDGERWLINVCDLEPIDPAEVPDRVRQLLPGVRYLISIGMEPINPSRAGWAFLNRVVTALATGSHGLGCDAFTDEPIR